VRPDLAGFERCRRSVDNTAKSMRAALTVPTRSSTFPHLFAAPAALNFR
jgi:hypothetical protein